MVSGLSTGSKWSAPPTLKVSTSDESGANPKRRARTLYRPGLGARSKYLPSGPLNVPAMITPVVLTRTIVVPGEPACDSNIWTVPLTCWQNTLGVRITEATLSLNKGPTFIRVITHGFRLSTLILDKRVSADRFGDKI